MSLSTGFDSDKVAAAMAGRIGWRNPTLAGYNIVDVANQASASGRYFNDGSFHASCTIQNLKETQEDPMISDAAFNALLSSLEKSIILQSVNSVFDNLEVIESGLLYRRSGLPASFTPTAIPNSNKFCGIRINIAGGDFAVSVDKVTVLLDSAKTFNLYLYKDFKTAPVATIPVTTVANEETTVSIAKVLNYLSDTNKGGAYYIGYYQSDLGDARALDCAPFLNTYKVFSAVSFEADVTGIGFNKYSYSVNHNSYGLNAELTSTKDFTETIIKGAAQFDEYIGLSMAAKVIEQVVNTQRSNNTERQGNINVAKLNEELNAPDHTDGLPISPGIKSRLSKELKRLKSVFHQKDKTTAVDLC